MKDLKVYLKTEWIRSVAKKYQQKKYQSLFDDWYNNLTENQRTYFTAYADGKKSPFVGEKQY